MSFKTTKDKIKDILDGLTGTDTNDLFAKSYDYLEPSPQIYPCAMVGVFGGSGEDMVDNAYNGTGMQFVIRVYLKNKNTSANHDLLLTTIDSLLAELRKEEHFTLDGTVQKFGGFPSIPVYYTDQTDEPVIGFDVVVNVLKLNQTF